MISSTSTAETKGWLDPKKHTGLSEWHRQRYEAHQRRLRDVQLRRTVKQRTYRGIAYTEATYLDHDYKKIVRRTYLVNDNKVMTDNREATVLHEIHCLFSTKDGIKAAIDSYLELDDE
tara:strand:- start:50 stop:403 length:354 start_codon:yes stop_codon:yes gene_type:complete